MPSEEFIRLKEQQLRCKLRIIAILSVCQICDPRMSESELKYLSNTLISELTESCSVGMVLTPALLKRLLTHTRLGNWDFLLNQPQLPLTESLRNRMIY